MLYSLVYVSVACVPLSAEELGHVARISEINNRRDAVTGILLHKNGHFMQMLEGARRRVEDKKQRILLDPRHRDLRVLAQGFVPTREFSEFPMVFHDLNLAFDSESDPGTLDAIGGLDAPVFVNEPERARKLLLSFRAAGRPRDQR